MPRTLTPKQENFCQQFISTSNASEAYRQSYDCSKMKKENVGRRAKELIDNSKVAARIGGLLEEGRNRHDITVASLTEQLQDAYGLAMQTGDTAAIGATWALAINYTGWISLLRKSRRIFSQRSSSVWLIIRNRWESLKIHRGH